jgi:hypothetical protein
MSKYHYKYLTNWFYNIIQDHLKGSKPSVLCTPDDDPVFRIETCRGIGTNQLMEVMYATGEV